MNGSEVGMSMNCVHLLTSPFSFARRARSHCNSAISILARNSFKFGVRLQTVQTLLPVGSTRPQHEESGQQYSLKSRPLKDDKSTEIREGEKWIENH